MSYSEADAYSFQKLFVFFFVTGPMQTDVDFIMRKGIAYHERLFIGGELLSCLACC